MANNSWFHFPGSVMSTTLTQTRTFTIGHARYVASKIAADLDLLRAYHGKPSESMSLTWLKKPRCCSPHDI
jgi:hypothetical protein